MGKIDDTGNRALINNQHHRVVARAVCTALVGQWWLVKDFELVYIIGKTSYFWRYVSEFSYLVSAGNWLLCW